MQVVPDFETVYSEFESMMFRDAYEAISKCNLWEWLRTYSPEKDKGFMFSEHPNLTRINKSMKFDGHSGASYAITMRVMESIAKNGWEALKSQAQQKNSPCPCRSQAGFTSGWCGVAGGGVPACDH
jgi:hypothetical protein